MDKQSSWTKGSNNDFKAAHKNDNYQSSFEFLDMSSCDESQKLKLKNTLDCHTLPLFSAVTSPRDRYRSNFTRNTSIKPQPYSTNQYHSNNSIKSQKPNYQSYSTKHLNTLEHQGSISTRSFSSEANSFSSKNNSNFNNNISTNNNENRHFSNTQDKLSKWQTHNKKPPPNVGLRDSIHTIPNETKKIGGAKEQHLHHQQLKEVTRDQSKSFNRNMSPPPLTSFQTNTTSTTTSSSPSSMSNQGNMAMPHFQYGSHPQMYPQMYHPLDHQANSSSQQQHPRGGGMGRRGRSRGGNNNINRRDFQFRQNSHQQQNQQSNEYGQPMMDQSQPGVMSSAPYQQFYIHYPPWQNTLPQNLNLTQNLTGQPLFAIQQPLLYNYGSPYPIMYNVMPQAHPMSHQQPEMMENEIQEPIVWPQIAHPQMFQHSPHLNAGGEIEYQAHPEEYHMIEHANEYHPEELEMNSNTGEVYEDGDQTLVEKTRDLMIQTTPPPPPSEDIIVPNQLQKLVIVSSSENEGSEPVIGEKVIDNKMIVKNVEKPPAWGIVPNLSAQQKKQMASVSVSAIPKDVEHCETENEPVLTEESVELKPTSFSLITASKSNTSLEGKKTENKQNEVQQMVLIERAKQQIVTTITGISSNEEKDKKVENHLPEVIQNQVEVLTVEKSAQVSKPITSNNASPSPSSSAARPASTASWAGLFNPKSERTSKNSPQPQMHSQQPPETHKLLTAKNSDAFLAPAPQLTATSSTSQVPVTAMSYSAVSAQPAINQISATNNHVTPHSVVNKDLLPQSKVNLPQNINVNANSNNNNHVKTTPVDQHALKLGDFFSKYKIESNSISLLPRGLINKSNYCYINAILQALVSCPPFYHLMKAVPQIPPTYRNQTKTPVIDAMIELVSNYSLMPYRKWTPREKGKKDEVPDIARDTAFEPSVVLKMLQALRTEMFPVEGRQEDAEEFLSFILNRMNDEMIELKKLVEKPKIIPKKEENGDDVNGNVEIAGDDDDEWQVISGTRNKSTITRTTDFGRSPISDIFGGKLRLRVHREGDHSSDNIEPFFTLKLVIEKASSVREALDILVGRDQLEGVTCSRTNQEVAAWQQVTLEELPVVLILHLKCFDFKKDGCTKILKTVEFPVELKLDQKIMASKNKYQQKQKQYKLFAVIYHDGKEASKGHYITDVFHLSYSSWIRYDDSSVKAVPEHNVLHPKSPRVPYLLFYRRFDTIGQASSKIQPNKI